MGGRADDFYAARLRLVCSRHALALEPCARLWGGSTGAALSKTLPSGGELAWPIHHHHQAIGVGVVIAG